MNDLIILAEGVGFGYTHRQVLDGLTLHVPRGSVTGLLGPNGSGKTTLMNLLNGFFPPRQGLIRIMGLDPWRQRDELQRYLAFVPEHPEIYPWMKIRYFIDFYHRIQPTWDAGYFRRKLDEFQISTHIKIGSLSRGQQGLISLLTALARHSEFLLLDDPTLGLDVLARRHLYTTIVEELADTEVTILFATHLPAEVEGLLTHAAFIRHGCIIRQGAIEELKSTNRFGSSGMSLEELTLAYAKGES
jgi:ABC-2 type transport system ATP-binding protein